MGFSLMHNHNTRDFQPKECPKCKMQELNEIIDSLTEKYNRLREVCDEQQRIIKELRRKCED